MDKYLKEGLLIVFSVLFALFINKLFDDFQIGKKKNIALFSIGKEITNNQVILSMWKQHHIEIRDRISSIIDGKNDSLKMELKKYNHLNFGTITGNKSLIDAVLTNTAWESAKMTGIIAEFDFETTQKLTLAYTMQSVLTDRTIDKILDYYFEPGTHDMDELDATLIQFQLRFWELTGQEELMTTLYQDALDQLRM